MSSPSPVLEANELAIEVGGAPLIRGFSLDLAAGEAVALRAPSGAGKTTVLRTLSGLHPFARGTLRLRGEAPDTLGWSQYRRRVALVSQTPVMLEGTVQENLAFAFTLQVSAGAFPSPRAEELLVEFGLDGALDQPARDLSVGEAQRVHLIRSLLLDPDVLLLDEPTSALDPARRDVVEARLAALRGTGVAMVLVTHDETQADRIADRVVDLSGAAL